MTSKKMIVYAGMKHTHVNFIDRNMNYLYTTDSVEAYRIANSFWKTQKLNHPVLLKNNNWYLDGYINFEGARILILNKELLKLKTQVSTLKLDYLIIGNGLKPRIKEILESFLLLFWLIPQLLEVVESLKIYQ